LEGFASLSSGGRWGLDVSVAVLQRAKANLRPTKTRVAPERYPSRIPFIEEMHQLATKFREQQRAMRLEQ